MVHISVRTENGHLSGKGLPRYDKANFGKKGGTFLEGKIDPLL